MTAQHSTLGPAIRECADAVAATTAGIRDEQLQDPTPCEKFTVAELLDHLGTTLQASVRAARKEGQSGAGAAPATSPRDLADTVGLAAAAWSEPAAYEGTTEFGPGEMPAVLAASIILHELALHGWDLARAAGLPFAVSEETARIALGVVEQIGGQVRENGDYGPPVAVPADASVFQRALGASGRNPGWQG
ncbi:TIGR03086 family metal-binding protein [Streptomyces sp. NPDC005209]|uniref:TIGR03086 family metal-binding protein n=1 Tax=Streptomyces sp. NPDC005209 TaxID=3156715 RepID=UPI0033A08528